MQEQINVIYQNAIEAISAADNLKSLDEIRVAYLGKSGLVTGLLKGMRDLPQEERPKVGQLVNELREKIPLAMSEKESELKKAEITGSGDLTISSTTDNYIETSESGKMSVVIHPNKKAPIVRSVLLLFTADGSR